MLQGVQLTGRILVSTLLEILPCNPGAEQYCSIPFVSTLLEIPQEVDGDALIRVWQDYAFQPFLRFYREEGSRCHQQGPGRVVSTLLEILLELTSVRWRR